MDKGEAKAGAGLATDKKASTQVLAYRIWGDFIGSAIDQIFLADNLLNCNNLQQNRCESQWITTRIGSCLNARGFPFPTHKAIGPSDNHG